MARLSVEALLDREAIPDAALRWTIRRRLAQRLQQENRSWVRDGNQSLLHFLHDLDSRPVATKTAVVNEQHYELPPAFFQLILGERMKYSCGYWPAVDTSLDESENAMLELYCRRADLQDGQRILELGCGWGSLSLLMAERYPRAQVVAISNSRRQGEYLLRRAQERSLKNLSFQRVDINSLRPDQKFDRIVSVEMFEHIKNYKALLQSVSTWLEPSGLLFVHMFVHRELTYHFEDRGPGDWMARHFFTGGTMASESLLPSVQSPLVLREQWRVPGTHYERTSNAWLKRMDEHRDKIWPTLENVYGVDHASRWWARWRLFFMACAEMFGYRRGTEWWVSHYLFARG